MNHIYRHVWNKHAGMLVAVAEFARARGKAAGSNGGADQARSVIAGAVPHFNVAVIAMAVLAAFPLAVQAQSTSFLDFSSLAGWTTQGGTALLTTTDSYNLGGQPYSLTPAAGNSMVKITAQGSTINGAVAADTALGLSAGTIAGLLGNSTTNFGLLSKTFTFNPGTYSFAWAYAAGDYQPYNDGVLFSVVGQGTQNVLSLARNGKDANDKSGPQTETLVLGSYGSTAWITTSFTIAAAGDYRVSYADYNWADTGQDPVYYVSGVAGTFTGTAIVPVGGGTPAPVAISTGNTSGSSGLAAGTVAPTFDGGVLAMDKPDGTYAQNFTITAQGGTIDQAGTGSTFTGVVSGAGPLAIVDSGAGGAVTFTAANTYTGATEIGTGATLALSGAGSIAASSGITTNGTLDIAGTSAGATVTSLAGNGSVVLGNQTLTLSNASDTFGGGMAGAGGLTIAGGNATFAGVNGYTGATTIGAGATLALTGAGSVAASSGVSNLGTFDLTGAATDVTVTTLGGPGAVVLGPNSLVLSAAAGDIGGSIKGNGGLAVMGGNATLSGANTYTGLTTVGSGATLALSGAGTLGASSGVVADGTLNLAAAAGSVAVTSLKGSGVVALGTNNLVLTAAAGNFFGSINGGGGLSVAGGAATLSGANTYTGPTQIDSGAALLLSGDGSVAASSGVLNNGILTIASTAPAAVASLAGTGTVNLAGQGLTLTQAADNFSGTIAGTGNLTVRGGVQQLSGINTLSGTVSAIDGGTLKIASGASLGAAGNTLALANGILNATGTTTLTQALSLSGAGTLDIDAGTTLTANGAASGTGTLVKTGTGTLVLGGDNSALTGGATLNGGTVKLASASAVGGGRVQLNAGTLETGVNLTLAQNVALAGGTSIRTGAATTATLAGAVTTSGGSGCFTKSGAGTLNLTGAANFGTGLCVEEGTLRVNGLTASGLVAVMAGATLRGTGTIAAPITVSGTLAPGNSPGTLTSSGTVIMAAGSRFQEDINGTGTRSGPGNYSRLIITGNGQFIAGNATLTPNLVNITGADVYTPYVPKVGESYRIVTAAGGVVGRFGTVVQPVGLATNTRLAVFYDGDGSNSIDLRVLPTSYSSYSLANGGNRNAQLAGAALDKIITADQAGTATARQAALAYAVSNTGDSSVAALAQNLSGEIHAAMATAAPLAGQSVQGSVLRQLDGANTGSALWADLAGNRAEWDQDANAGGFTANRGQLTVGADALRNDAGRVGVGFSHARANLSTDAGSGTLRQNLAFIYGAYQGNGLGLDAMAGTGRSNWETERANPLGAGALRTGLDGRNTLASIGISAPVQADGATFKPFVRVLWQRTERDAGSENTAALAALTLGQYKASGTRATAGVSGNVKGGEVGNTPYTMQYSVGAGRDNGNLSRSVVDSSIAGVSTTILAPQAGRAFMQAAVSGTVLHSATASSFYGIATELHNGRSDVSLSGGLRYAF